MAALARLGYGCSGGDAQRSDDELSQTLSKSHFGMFWSFHCYKRRCEVCGFVVASKENCKKSRREANTSKKVEITT